MASVIHRSFVKHNYISRLTVTTKCRPPKSLSFLLSLEPSPRSPLGPIRRFSASPRSAKAMESEDFKALRVRQDRLMETLHGTCVFGPGERWGSAKEETGMSRLALGDSDKDVRDWFVKTTKALGCNVTIDTMGNIFAVRPGRREGPATFAGSHLDTQPTGGRYDGILGILAGIEMLTVLRDHNWETEFPIGVVNWTNEEGARFPISMSSSGVWAEEIPLERAHNLQEVGGGTATMKSELERIGYLGSIPTSYKSSPMAAHFELHIEQGPILETEHQKVGVVKGVQAYKWFTVDVTGRDAHTGTTPLQSRADAMLLAARLIAHSHRVATAHSALASTGILTLSPSSTNTIPGRVSFTLDIRAPADATVEATEADLKRDFAILAAGEDVGGLLAGSTPGKPLNVEWRTDFVSPATIFHPDCIASVRASAEEVTGSSNLVRDMTSGAGHDSVYTSRRCPTSMIFVPSKNGVSHNPEEYTSPEDCAIGANVLLQSVLRYDRMRADGKVKA
ncbi:amidase [Annulohypoxylon truncatum]|uniref:amidase n=1 Tax=Annulohypoxylon truncatum TaxID=327061 RepID=UPI00200873A6|nr:amidase [Annulohypoxylon truncatum]KAI1205499.1 amidase [Annulohypoxylon truncatum]